jgi:hypothetical protein
MRSILLERHRLRGSRLDLCTPAPDLGVPSLGHARLALAIEAPQELQRQFRAIPGWQAKNLGEHVGGSHAITAASGGRMHESPATSAPLRGRTSR